MPKYRKKPVVIEAEQFFRDKHFDGKRVTIDGVETDVIAGERRFFIHTLEGRYMTVSEGDFVITGVKGERYPCKPDIFDATYEAVDEVNEDEVHLPGCPFLADWRAAVKKTVETGKRVCTCPIPGSRKQDA